MLLDVEGDEEPRYTNRTCFEVTVSSSALKAEETKLSAEYILTKPEEFDVDEFLSDTNHEFTCPTSPDSELASPDPCSNNRVDGILTLSTNTEKGLVGLNSKNGFCNIINEKFIDEEFFISPDELATLNDDNNIDFNDPLSELFPSLLSV